MPLSDTSLAFNQKSSPFDKSVTRTWVPSGTSSFSKGSILPPLTTARILSCIGSSICILSHLHEILAAVLLVLHALIRPAGQLFSLSFSHSTVSSESGG